MNRDDRKKRNEIRGESSQVRKFLCVVFAAFAVQAYRARDLS
jgi:hypothetical protein